MSLTILLSLPLTRKATRMLNTTDDTVVIRPGSIEFNRVPGRVQLVHYTDNGFDADLLIDMNVKQATDLIARLAAEVAVATGSR